MSIFKLYILCKVNTLRECNVKEFSMNFDVITVTPSRSILMMKNDVK